MFIISAGREEVMPAGIYEQAKEEKR